MSNDTNTTTTTSKHSQTIKVINPYLTPSKKRDTQCLTPPSIHKPANRAPSKKIKKTKSVDYIKSKKQIASSSSKTSSLKTSSSKTSKSKTAPSLICLAIINFLLQHACPEKTIFVCRG